MEVHQARHKEGSHLMKSPTIFFPWFSDPKCRIAPTALSHVRRSHCSHTKTWRFQCFVVFTAFFEQLLVDAPRVQLNSPSQSVEDRVGEPGPCFLIFSFSFEKCLRVPNLSYLAVSQEGTSTNLCQKWQTKLLQTKLKNNKKWDLYFSCGNASLSGLRLCYSFSAIARGI